MSKGLFENIGYVKSEETTVGPITPGQNRRKTIEAGNLWMGECHVTALDAPSQWHHHAEYDSVMYMLSGRIRVDHGAKGHDIKNLFVSDGSQFTTGGAENPTLTIVALAIRQAEFIAGEMTKNNI
jgi:hypothetical protein